MFLGRDAEATGWQVEQYPEVRNRVEWPASRGRVFESRRGRLEHFVVAASAATNSFAFVVPAQSAGLDSDARLRARPEVDRAAHAAREGALDKRSPALGAGFPACRWTCGRGGGRYKFRAVRAFCGGRLRGHQIVRVRYPAQSAGLDCDARLRARPEVDRAAHGDHL